MPETNKIREIMMKWFMLSNGGLEAYDFIEEEFEPYSYDVIADLIDDSEDQEFESYSYDVIADLIDDSEDQELNFDNLPCDYTTDEDGEVCMIVREE